MDREVAKLLAIGAVVPGVVSLVVWFLLWRTARGASAGAGRHALGSAALAALAVASQCVFLGPPNWPPRESFDLIVFVAPAWWVAAMAGTLPRIPAWFRMALGAAVGLTLALATTSRLPGDADPDVRWALWGVLVASALVPTAITRVATCLDRRAGIAVTLAWVAAASQAAVLVFHVIKLGQYTGFAAAFCASALLVSFARRSLSFGRGLEVVPIGMALHATFHGVVFGDTERPLLSAGLVVIGPLLAGVVVPTLRRAPGWARVGTAVALIVLPAAVAIALSVLA